MASPRDIPEHIAGVSGYSVHEFGYTEFARIYSLE